MERLALASEWLSLVSLGRLRPIGNQLTNDLMAAETMGQNIEPTSAPDQDGPIWGYHFVPNQPARSITSEAAVAFLSAPGPPPPDEFLWLHFSLSNMASEPWLRRYLTLPDAFYESLHSDIDATHLEQDGDSLVARIHDVLFDFTFDAPVATTTLCVQPRVLVSAHARPWRSIDQLRAAVEEGQVFRSSIEILARLLRDQASVLVDIVRKSKRAVGPMEEQLLAKRVSVSRSELGSLRRMLVRLQRLLARELDCIFAQSGRALIAARIILHHPATSRREGIAPRSARSSALVERAKELRRNWWPLSLGTDRKSHAAWWGRLVSVRQLPMETRWRVCSMKSVAVSGNPTGSFRCGSMLVNCTSARRIRGWVDGRSGVVLQQVMSNRINTD